VVPRFCCTFFVPRRRSHLPALFVFNVIVCIVYTLLLESSTCRSFREVLFLAVLEGGFVGGFRIRVFMNVACKVSAGF
jgi:hypothetical protein